MDQSCFSFRSCQSYCRIALRFKGAWPRLEAKPWPYLRLQFTAVCCLGRLGMLQSQEDHFMKFRLSSTFLSQLCKYEPVRSSRRIRSTSFSGLGLLARLQPTGLHLRRTRLHPCNSYLSLKFRGKWSEQISIPNFSHCVQLSHESLNAFHLSCCNQR